MLTTMLLTIVLISFAIFFIIYKRKLLLRILSIDMAAPASQLQQQLAQTGDAIIEQLENKITHLEYLLEVADEKIAELEKQIATVKEMPNVPLEERLPELPIANQVVKAYNSQKYMTRSGETGQVNVENNKESDIRDSSKQNVSEDKRRLILAMADQGYNVTEIAKATGIGKGAIMLLLQLNKK